MQENMLERRYEKLKDEINTKEPFYRAMNLSSEDKEIFVFLIWFIKEIMIHPPKKIHSRVLFEFELNLDYGNPRAVIHNGAKMTIRAHKASGSTQVKSFEQPKPSEYYEGLLISFVAYYGLSYRKSKYAPRRAGHDVLIEIIFGDPNAVV